MNEQIKQAIFEKIKAAPRIMLFRHIRMDGDCAGASKGLKALIRATFPPFSPEAPASLRGVTPDILLLWITVALSVIAMVVYGVQAVKTIRKNKEQ